MCSCEYIGVSGRPGEQTKRTRVVLGAGGFAYLLLVLDKQRAKRQPPIQGGFSFCSTVIDFPIDWNDVMSWTGHEIINGYSIYFHTRLAFGGNGIAFEPDEANFNDPRFIAALKQAADLYPYMEAVGFLGEYAHMPDYLLNAPEQYRSELWQAYLRMEEGINRGLLDISYRESRQAVIDILTGQYRRIPKEKIQGSIPKKGFVYVLKADNGYYKIGKTVNPEDRIKTFTIKLPFHVEYELLIESENYTVCEKRLHGLFADKRIDGEWFALTSEDIAEIRREYG